MLYTTQVKEKFYSLPFHLLFFSNLLLTITDGQALDGQAFCKIVKDDSKKENRSKSQPKSKQCPQCATLQQIKEREYGFVGVGSWKRLTCFAHKPVGTVALTRFSKKVLNETLEAMGLSKTSALYKSCSNYPYLWIRKYLQETKNLDLNIHIVRGDGDCWLHAVRFLMTGEVKEDVTKIEKAINREEFYAHLSSVDSNLCALMQLNPKSYLPLYALKYMASMIKLDILCINIEAIPFKTTYEKYAPNVKCSSFIILIMIGKYFNVFFIRVLHTSDYDRKSF